MTDDKQTQAQSKFEKIMKVESPQLAKAHKDEHMAKWLELLKSMGVAKLTWNSYYSDDETHFDDYELEDKSGKYVSPPKRLYVDEESVEEYVTGLQDSLYDGENGEYVLYVEDGEVRRESEIYESSETVTDSIEHVAHKYNPETKQWVGPYYPELTDEPNAPYYIQIKLSQNENMERYSEIKSVNQPIGETDRWVTYTPMFMERERYLGHAIKKAKELSELASDRANNKQHSTRVIDRLGNILYVASILGVDWDARAPFSIVHIEIGSLKQTVIQSGISSYAEADRLFDATVKEFNDDPTNTKWQLQLRTSKDTTLNTRTYHAPRATNTLIGETSMLYSLSVEKGAFPKNGEMRELDDSELLNFAKHLELLADWKKTTAYGKQVFGDTAVKFEIEANSEYDDEGGYYWSISDFVAYDKDDVVLSRLPEIERIKAMIEDGTVAKRVANQTKTYNDYKKQIAEAKAKGLPESEYGWMVRSMAYYEPLFEGEASLENESFMDWARKYLDENRYDEYSENLSYNPDAYIYVVDQPPQYKNAAEGMRYFVWIPPVKEVPLEAKKITPDSDIRSADKPFRIDRKESDKWVALSDEDPKDHYVYYDRGLALAAALVFSLHRPEITFRVYDELADKPVRAYSKGQIVQDLDQDGEPLDVSGDLPF